MDTTDDTRQATTPISYRISSTAKADLDFLAGALRLSNAELLRDAGIDDVIDRLVERARHLKRFTGCEHAA